MNRAGIRVLFTLALAAAAAVRLARLDLRPMHHDEANQALKFAALLERGEYRYDPADHHGPSLYYLTLPAAGLAGRSSLAELDETVLRAVPAVFSAAAVLLILILGRALGDRASLLAGGFAALSPALVYYGRFYIQESVFAFFALAFLVMAWRYLVSPSAGRALAVGALAGLAHATKETSVIVFAVAAAAAVSGLAVSGGKRALASLGRRIRPLHALAALAAFGLVAAALFSSFFSNPAGLRDSVLAYGSYFHKSGAAGLHLHPWTFYLRILGFSSAGGLIWSEAPILLLGLVGGFSAFAAARRRRAGALSLGIFLFFTAVGLTAVFSAIPYKTPWNLLPFHVLWTILAGVGGIFLVRQCPWRSLKIAALAGLAGCLYLLGTQCFKANYRYPADPRNPYVYAQTSTDYLGLVRRIEALAAVHPAGRSIPVKVVAGPYEQWPLPWSLRRFDRVGYWTDAADAGPPPAGGLAVASVDNEAAVEALAGEGSVIEHYGLRPGAILALFIPPDLWRAFLRTRGGP